MFYLLFIPLLALIVVQFYIIKKEKKENLSNKEDILKFYNGEIASYRGIAKNEKSNNEKLKFGISKIADFFDTFKYLAIDTERSSGKLSSNVQKTLLNSSSIAVYTQSNRERTNELFNHISEGSAAVEEIQASIGSLREHIVIQNNKVNDNQQSINNMRSNIQNISSIAQDRVKDSQNLVELTGRGAQKIDQTNKLIQVVRGSVNDVLSLNTVINTIASKTNLLSMNAAIEAAHAGEAGKGFAVVAEEIRKLAAMTAQNATNISTTLKELEKNIVSASDLSSSSGKTFTEIKSGVDSVTNAFNDITGRTIELLDNAGNVTTNTQELVQISDETKSSITEMEVGAEDLTGTFNSTKSLAHSLNESMEDLYQNTKEVNYTAIQLSSSFSSINKTLISFIRNIAEITSKGDVQSNLEKRMIHRNLVLSHINWIAKARAIIDGKLDVKEANIVSSDNCELGKWLNSEAEKNGDNTVLRSKHDKIHEIVKEIAECILRGDKAKAKELYTSVTPLSKEIVEILSTGNKAIKVEWTPELTVGVDLWDEHHRVLFGLINKLSHSMSTGDGTSALLGIVNELIEYTAKHFKAEEDAFKQFNYPDAQNHIAVHNAFVKKAIDIRSSLELGDNILSTEVLDFLQDWITDHIMIVDKKYEAFFRGISIV